MPPGFCQSLIKADQRDPGRDDRCAVDYGYQTLTAMIFRSDELRFAARNSELLSRDVTNCPTLAVETEEALSGLENTVRIRNVNYPFWSEHNEWVDSLRTEARFEGLMVEVKREWVSITRNPDRT